MSRLRYALVVLLFAAFAGSLVFSVLRVIAPPPAPADVQPGPALSARLAKRVLLVIVDGLRFDVATDPVRMPKFAEAMRRESSGEAWAGRVSMTTSAVLALGTGQHGRLEQVVRNLGPQTPPHNTWLENARAAGLALGAVGDPSWVGCYGKDLAQHRDDPAGVAIDVDFNPQTFRATRELLARNLDFLVAHFVTPDHQGHAYGVTSQRYTAHIQGFDRDLAALLAEVPRDTTVIVTSDHGASDSGKHGTDVAIQRRTPIYAYGPGIRPGVPLERPLDQLELSALLPTLLGVPAPAHRTGHVVSEWLDVTDAERARIACDNARHVVAYARRSTSPDTVAEAARLVVSCPAGGPAPRAEEIARRAVALADRAVDENTGLLSPSVLWWLGLVSLMGIGLIVALGKQWALRSLPAVVGLLSLTVWLVIQVERLPGGWPDRARIALFVLCNAALLSLLLRPNAARALLERAMPHAPALVPATLVLSYSANTRPESYAALGVCALAYAREPSPAPTERSSWATRAGVVMPLVLALLALLPVALKDNEGFSGLIADERARPFAYAALLSVWLGWFRSKLGLGLGAGVALAAFGFAWSLSKSHVGPLVGQAGWLASMAMFAVLSLRRGNDSRSAARAVAAGVLGFAWLARDFEMLPLLGAVTVAFVVGDAIARRQANSADRERPAAGELMVEALFAFALGYALRIGIQDGVDFGGMDWHAGAFADPNVPATLVGVALVYKYALCLMLVLSALGARATHQHERLLFTVVSACFAARALALAAMFFLAGNSYWTALRVLGDLPTALAMTLGALAALGVNLARRQRA